MEPLVPIRLARMRTTPLFALLFALLNQSSCAFVSSQGATTKPPKVPTDDFVRDAEIKHGRVALVSGAVLAGLASTGFEHPTSALAHASVDTQLFFFSAIGVAEAATYLPRMSSMLSLRDGIVPGELIPRISADPLLEEIELNASRAAMMAVLLYMLIDVASY